MTKTNTTKILKQPVSGSQRPDKLIIQGGGPGWGKTALSLPGDLLHARNRAKGKGVSAPRKRAGVIASMQHAAIEDELAYWRQCGYRN